MQPVGRPPEVPRLGHRDEVAQLARLHLRYPSGLPAGRDIWRIAQTPLEARALVLSTPLEGRPGAQYIYSDLGADVLGMLVEVVAGEKTSPETVERAISFYTSIGKRAIHVRKEVVGHVANRLQAALYREVVYLIEQGVLDVADSDAAVSWGPGLRWGLMCPHMLFHLGGGQGGIQHFMEHLSGPVATWWKDLGTITEFSPEVKQTIVDGVLKEANGRSISELERERDGMLLELLATRAKVEKAVRATADAAD